MSQHTPGPWKIKDNDIVNKDTWIATVGQFTDSGTDLDAACKANAALIMAAPDLLQFAKNVEAYLAGLGTTRYDAESALLNHAEQVILKAEGKR